MEDRIKEVEEKNDRLLLELGYLQGKISKIDDYKRKIEKLEKKCAYLMEREERAWDRCDEAFRQRDLTRDAAAEAIRLLQVEVERLSVSRETSSC
jgi:hypothetical protein